MAIKDNSNVSFEELASFMMKLLIISSSTSQVERDFSMMADVKTKKRNRLKPKLVNAIPEY